MALSLPHAPPALAVTGLRRAPDGVYVDLRVPADWSLLVDGACPALLGLELVGQACAAWAAAGGEGAEGVILRVRALKLDVDALPVDAPLVAHLTRPDGADGTPGRLATFHATLYDGDATLLSGALLVQRLDPRSSEAA